jgi:hypothetical protein
MSRNQYIIACSWGWGSLGVLAGLLLAFISGWTLLHSYTPLFCFCVAAFGGSFLVIPAIIGFGVWQWRKQRIDPRVFLLHFAVPQALAITGLIIGYVVETIRAHPA